jgi:tetratricopeptide (TPR) repeat protein
MVLALGVGLTVVADAAPPTAVRVWRDTLTLPTTAEGPPNPNPPFDLFAWSRINYPYPIRDALLGRQQPRRWRALHLENEYLHLTVLPDLGGHVYRCLDKVSGREMFYANRAIKMALIGYRGAWAAFGIEFNFPVSHNWVSMSPVDFAAATLPDGSGEIQVGNVDAVVGSAWRVALRLRPGRAVLEQHVTLENRGDTRHRYYWWTNAAVEAWDDSRLVYPTAFMATHGFTRVQPWPVDEDGRDLSVIGHQTGGPVSLFTHGTREPFVGVYHPRTRTGTVHVAAPSDLPAHKVWSWGADAEAHAWREALSDDRSAYVELQAGLFRDQETYGFLEPLETVQFTESWLPVRDLDGITRATADAVLHASRAGGSGVFALNVTRALPGARVAVRQGAALLWQGTVSLTPARTWRRAVGVPSTAPWTFTLADTGGAVLLEHVEGQYDLAARDRIDVGPQPAAPRAADAVDAGRRQELAGRRLQAMAIYRDGLARQPGDRGLLEAAGRLATSLGWTEALTEADAAADPLAWLRAAQAADPADPALRYTAGLARAARGDARGARADFEAAARFRATRAPASLQLARLLARERDWPAAAAAARDAVEAAPASSLAASLEVAVLRVAGRTADARARLDRARALDPASSLMRYEAVRLGGDDPALWDHLAMDANRVLDLVDQYLALGALADARDLLTRSYPPPDAPREPGAIAPEAHPLVAYYRGYVRERLGEAGREDYRRAAGLPLAYVFPNRTSSYAVLRAALAAAPEDHAARFLLGALYFSDGLVDRAIGEWERVRAAQPAIPTLHRNLGLALLHGRGDVQAARAVLEEGLRHDPANVEVYQALDGVLSAIGAPAGERLAALRRFPADARLPAPLVFARAIAHAETGDADAAEALLRDSYLPREEGGTSARAVALQVRLLRIDALAARGACGEALAVVDGLGAEASGMRFTRGGLQNLVDMPVTQWGLAEIERACGRRDASDARFTRLAEPRETAGALRLAVADAARRRLGRPADAAWERRLSGALDATRAAIDAGEGSNPGLARWTEGLLLRALGRDAEARAAWRDVFRWPDRNLSHSLARTTLRALGGEPVR